METHWYARISLSKVNRVAIEHAVRVRGACQCVRGASEGVRGHGEAGRLLEPIRSVVGRERKALL